MNWQWRGQSLLIFMKSLTRWREPLFSHVHALYLLCNLLSGSPQHFPRLTLRSINREVLVPSARGQKLETRKPLYSLQPTHQSCDSWSKNKWKERCSNKLYHPNRTVVLQIFLTRSIVTFPASFAWQITVGIQNWQCRIISPLFPSYSRILLASFCSPISNIAPSLSR